MPKRANPFSTEYSPLQMKMHVTQREVNTGVSREKNMKAVYDRTLQLLYEGQKNLTVGAQEVEMEACEPISNATQAKAPSNDTAHPRENSPLSLPWSHNQLQLSSNGQLMYPSHPSKQHNVAAASKVLCVSCCNPSIPVHFVCAYCERNLCSNCRRICVNCESGFCSNCSTINYDERCDRVFCLNCCH